MILRVLILAILSVSVWAEPFVYSSSSSAGSKQIKRNKQAIYRLKQETARLREDIDGLRSIIEGLNRTINRLKQQKVSDNTATLNDMASLLDKINQNYVSKEEMRKALKVSSPNTPPAGKTERTKTKPKKSSSGGLGGASSAALYSKGVRLVNKKRYEAAKKRFDILAARGYKKPSTHFYLGEIAYRTGRYSTAVEEYKQSAELDENAGYMDKLLLHTGLALRKSGDKAQAKRFFQAIVDGYPNTSSAKIARKYL
jgi:TolA-binding protein